MDITQRLKSLDCFRDVPEWILKNLSCQFEVVYIRQREVLFKEDTPIKDLYIVLYGSFKIQRKIPSSTPVILNFLGRGEFLGVAMAGLNYPKYPASAIANEDSAVLRFDRDFFLKELMKMDGVLSAVNQQIGERFLEFQNDRCMEKARVPQKVADFLIRIWSRQKDTGNSQIIIPITRKDIAHRVGTHSETVIRVLSVWTKKGWIKTIDRRIEILDLGKLQEVRDEGHFEYPSGSTSDNSQNVGST